MKRIALVTGGVGGIGTAVCRKLAADGHFVIANYAIAGTEDRWRTDMAAAGQRDADALVRALAPFAAKQQYLSFIEHPTDASTGYDPVTWGRLVAVKSAYDPDAVLVANHPVRRTFEIED